MKNIYLTLAAAFIAVTSISSVYAKDKQALRKPSSVTELHEDAAKSLYFSMALIYQGGGNSIVFVRDDASLESSYSAQNGSMTCKNSPSASDPYSCIISADKVKADASMRSVKN
jgi:hypothetical protein